MTTPTLQEAQAAYDTADAAYNKAHGDLNDAKIALRAARIVLDQAKSDAAQPHEWEGRKVTRQDTKLVGGVRWGRFVPITLTGVVFTYRVGMDVGRGHYNVRPGDAFVRICKANGEPGKITQRLNLYWSLVGEPTQPTGEA